MPSARRSPTRPGAGPGRGTRSRTTTHRTRSESGSARSGSPVKPEQLMDSAADESADAAVDEGRQPQSVAETRRLEAVRRRSSLTTRAIALAVVMLVLIISYASSLRIYLSQRHEIASTKAEIAQRQNQITDLQSTLNRSNDPNYVKTQARVRFGWVVPGETGYRVIGADGKVVGGPESIGGTSTAVLTTPPEAWWQKLWGSVKAADADPVAQPQPSKQPTITQSTRPKG